MLSCNNDYNSDTINYINSNREEKKKKKEIVKLQIQITYLILVS